MVDAHPTPPVRLSTAGRRDPHVLTNEQPRPRYRRDPRHPAPGRGLRDRLERGFIGGSLEHEGPEPAQVPVTVAGAEVVPPDHLIGDFDSDGERPASPFTTGTAHEHGVAVLEQGRAGATEEMSAVRADVLESKGVVVAGQVPLVLCD